MPLNINGNKGIMRKMAKPQLNYDWTCEFVMQNQVQ